MPAYAVSPFVKAPSAQTVPLFWLLAAIAAATFQAATPAWGAPSADTRPIAILPDGVQAIWDMQKAYRQTTSTRQRVCINGLWRWQPAQQQAEQVPEANWGYFKVPGCWPGIGDYMQKDSQTLYAHPSWKGMNLGGIGDAWYQRQIAIPADWAGRRIELSLEYLNSYAVVFVEGKRAGEVRFPGGRLDLTAFCRPGGTHMLSIYVAALPLQAVLLSYTDSAAARQVKAAVARRGLCGDVYLESLPAGPRIADVRIETSVRNWQIAFDVLLENLDPQARYMLRAEILDGGKTVAQFRSPPFGANQLTNGRISFSNPWKPDRLWDIHTPQNVYHARLTLLAASGTAASTAPASTPAVSAPGVSAPAVSTPAVSAPATSTPAECTAAQFTAAQFTAAQPTAAALAAAAPTAADGRELDIAYPVRFGFRQLWIDGRDFYLNGSRIWLSCVPLDNAQISAALASYQGAKESMLRLKSFGINFVYTHNYGCQPGSHLSFAEVLRAADDVGMLVSFSQPHFSHYDWKAPDADANNGYARHAEFYVRAAQNHPSVVFYSMSHNATGYAEDMNPHMTDGIQHGRDRWSENNARLALRSEAIVRRLDPSRIVYHHASGNLGAMHVTNFYPNFVPIQEMSDWFEHWATKGVKPVFTCEYGAPFTWDWAMYRGWFRGQREFGSARVPWEFCFAEWNAQFLGDRAYRISEAEKANLRWEAKQFRSGRLWQRWDYPYEIGSRAFDDRYIVLGMYLHDNWRAFRTWGVSAISPWEHGHYWRLREGVDKRRQELKTDWENLQRPGFSPDYIEGRYERMDLAFELNDWIAMAPAQALLRNNRPLLAYIAGKPQRFTSKDHNCCPGDRIAKQIVVINNSRQTVKFDCRWTLDLPQPAAGTLGGELPTGQQHRAPVEVLLPKDLAAGQYRFRLTARFNTGEVQEDEFAIDVLPRPAPPAGNTPVALFDPKGQTAELLTRCGLAFRRVQPGDDLSGYEVLVVGKEALSLEGPGPNVQRVQQGLKVIVLEQTGEVLEKRLGFRIAEYGLRQVFRRLPDHPAVAGLAEQHLANWRGEATLLPPKLSYQLDPRRGPIVRWCDIPVPRLWRCGNWGNVASVLIEKPHCGDFLPIIDGGFSLRYSPLMEYREGRGLVLFCQMDVTGRTEQDPAAEHLVRNIFRYVLDWKPTPRRDAWYAGEAAGMAHLERIGVTAREFKGQKLSAQDVLVAGPNAVELLIQHQAELSRWLRDGGHMLLVGLGDERLNALLPTKVGFRQAEHIAACFDPPGLRSLLGGVSPADVHNRDPRQLPLVTSGAAILGDGVVARADGANVLFCQLVPWQFQYGNEQYSLKRTFRRTSFLLSRLLANLGVGGSTPLLTRFHTPLSTAQPERRWLQGLYLDEPEEWDAPYRFFRW